MSLWSKLFGDSLTDAERLLKNRRKEYERKVKAHKQDLLRVFAEDLDETLRGLEPVAQSALLELATVEMKRWLADLRKQQGRVL